VGEGSCLSPDSLLIVCSVLTIAGVSLSLGRILDVGIVEEVLDADQELLDGDGWPPILVLVQQAQANSA